MRTTKLSAVAILMAVLGAVSAFASPKIGDQVKMSGSALGNDGTTTSTLDYSAEITAYDSSTKIYTIRYDYTLNGQTSTEIGEGTEASFLTEDQAKQAIKNCVRIGGAL